MAGNRYFGGIFEDAAGAGGAERPAKRTKLAPGDTVQVKLMDPFARSPVVGMSDSELWRVAAKGSKYVALHSELASEDTACVKHTATTHNQARQQYKRKDTPRTQTYKTECVDMRVCILIKPWTH